MPETGVTPCGCRDCFETVISDDMTSPDLCADCLDAGCEKYCRACGTGDVECSNPASYDADPFDDEYEGYDPFGPDADAYPDDEDFA